MWNPPDHCHSIRPHPPITSSPGTLVFLLIQVVNETMKIINETNSLMRTIVWKKKIVFKITVNKNKLFLKQSFWKRLLLFHFSLSFHNKMIVFLKSQNFNISTSGLEQMATHLVHEGFHLGSPWVCRWPHYRLKHIFKTLILHGHKSSINSTGYLCCSLG